MMPGLKVRVDLRDLRTDEIQTAIGWLKGRAGFAMTAWQWSALNQAQSTPVASDQVLIVVPDFLYYARLASTGQTKTIIELPGSKLQVIRSAMACVPTGIRNLRGLASGDFWSAAEALLAFDMGLVGSGFSGEVMLQYNLSDFTWLFERQGFIQAFHNQAKNCGSWGIATQQPTKALSCCARWSIKPMRMMFTTGSTRSEAPVLSIAQRDYFSQSRMTIDMTQWPLELIAGDSVDEYQRNYDDEWLISHQAALKLFHQDGMLTP